jgi:ABC-type sugar transport system ATPase subunit
LQRQLSVVVGQPVRVGIRPEDLSFGTGGSDTLAEGLVVVVERLGAEILAYVSTPAAKDLLVVKLPRSSDVRPQQEICVSADLGKIHVFGTNGARCTETT